MKGSDSHATITFVIVLLLSLISNSRSDVENNVCEDAISITGGNLTGTFDDDVAEGIFPTCITANSGGPALWYSVLGTGLILEATTCSENTNADTKISVFSTSCSDLRCITGNDDNPSDSACDATTSGASTVAWQTVLDFPYFVVVHGASSTTEGDFELTLTSKSTCVDAYELEAGQQFISSTTSTEQLEVPNDVLTGADCVDDSSNAFGSNAVWFKFTGDGNTYEATTCLDEFFLFQNERRQLQFTTVFDTQLFVLTGSDCDSAFTCKAANDDSCGVQSSVEWETLEGVNYYIVVTGSGLASGDFGLVLNNLGAGDNPINDRCGENDIKLSLGNEYTASVTNVQTDSFRACRDDALENDDFSLSVEEKTGVWFNLIGNGEYIEITTCDIGTDTIADPRIAVYIGDNCAEDMICVAANDDAGTVCTSNVQNTEEEVAEEDAGEDAGSLRVGAATESTVRFETISGEKYRVFLSGFDPSLETEQNYGILAQQLVTQAPTIEEGENAPCFSLTTYAFVEGKGKTQMKDLVVGDRILESNGEYGILYAIDHYDETKLATFRRISYEYSNKNDEQQYNTDPLELTLKHMVFLDDHEYPIPAQSVKVGDQLRSLLGGAGEGEGSVVVTKVDTITRMGVINPLTKSGTVVVGDAMIVASTYSALFTTATATAPVGPSLLLSGDGNVQIMDNNNSSKYDNNDNSNAHFMVNNIENIFGAGSGTGGIGRVAIAQAAKTQTLKAATVGSPSPFVTMMMAMLLPTTKISHQHFFHAILTPYRFVCSGSGGFPLYPIEMMCCQQGNSDKNYNKNGVVWYGQLGRDLLALWEKQ